MAGKPWSDEMKLAASIRMKGKKLSIAHRKAISMGQAGNKRGPEVGDKIKARHIERIGTLEERFWRLVDKTGDCWEWKGRKDEGGYGISIGKNPPERRAHRLAAYFMYGPIPDGCLVCHHCDNPPCCNPDHLFLGTHGDNQRDAWAKGRKRKLFGKDNPMFGMSVLVANRKRDGHGKFI